MWKMQLSAVSFQPSVRTYVLEQALKHAGQPLVPLIPVVATRNHMELVASCFFPLHADKSNEMAQRHTMTKCKNPLGFMGSTIISIQLRPPLCTVQYAGDFDYAFTDAINSKER